MRRCTGAMMTSWLVLAWAWGCGCGARPGPRADSLAGPQTTAAGDAGGMLDGATPEDAGDAAQSRAVLDDPRLGAVTAAIAAGDLRAAAAAIGAAVDRYKPTGAELARWRYVQGSLLAKAGDPAGAAQSFDAACEVSAWTAWPYARLASARAHAAAGHHAEAMERATAVAEELPISAAARMLQADSLDASGNTAAAVELWKALLKARRHGPRWAEMSTRIADYLLKSPDAAQAREAASLLRPVTIEAPAAGVAAKARQLFGQAIERLPADERAGLQALTIDERLAQAQALADGGRRDDAIGACTRILDELGKAGGKTKAACDAAVIKAGAASKAGRKAVGADAWADGIVRCETHKTQLVTALFQGAKQTMSAGRTADAAKLYARVEAEFPSHSYADDARLRGARIARVMNDEPRSLQMLQKMPTDYPDGDMLEEGLFEIALRQMERSDWAGALGTLERSIALRPTEKPYHAAGRARYFAARMKGLLGRAAEQSQELQQLVKDYPFSYYWLLSWSRLASTDTKAASELLRAVEAQQEPGPALAAAGPEVSRPAFVRASELLQIGEPALARDEILTLGLSSESQGPMLWFVAATYARMGAHDLGFRVARARTGEWSPHFPAGRWRAAWELAFPRAWPAVVDREAARSNLPISVAYGIMREESAFEPEVVSAANAYGLMQLIVPTAKTVAEPMGLPSDPDALKRPEINIALGCRLLSSLRASYPAAPVLAAPSYNAGPGATRKWLEARGGSDFDLWVELIPYEETRNYTKRVSSSVAVYAWLYERERFEAIARLPLQAPAATP
jgi:soluble lytic murein transglycosylase